MRFDVWRRPAGDSKFHSIAAVVRGGSVVTRCHGRWPVSHECEESHSPPDEDRCGACSRALAEPAVDLRFDFGGEG